MFPIYLVSRFWSKVEINSSGCWNWSAGTRRDGYGQFWIPTLSISTGAHRFAYMAAFGEIPAGLLVCHTCDNTKCVNPSHLFVGTVQDNTDDMINKGRNFNAKKTHCIKGHAFTPENIILKKGKRNCRACYYASSLNYYFRKKAVKNEKQHQAN